MKKIVKGLLFLAIAGSMSMVGSCGGLVESGGDDVVDTSNTNHPLVGKRINKVSVKPVNGGCILLSLDRNDLLHDNPVDSLGYLVDLIYYPDSIKFDNYYNDSVFSVTGYFGTYPENFTRTYISDSVSYQYNIIYIKE